MDDAWEDVDAEQGKDQHVEEHSSYQVLPIARLPEDFDGNPVDGPQYLAMMQQMYKDLPFITSAPRPPSNAGVLKVPARYTPPTGARHPALPKESWEVSFTAHFVAYRKALLARPAAPVPSSALPPTDMTGFSSYMHGAKRKRMHTSLLPGAAEINAIKAAGIAPAVVDEDAEMAAMNDAMEEEQAQGEGAEDETGWEEFQEEDDEAEVELDVVGQDTAEVADVRASTGASSSSMVWEPEQPKHRGHEPSLPVIRSLSSKAILRLLSHFNTWLSRALELAEDPPTLISTQPDTPYVPSSSSLSLPFPPIQSRWIFSLLLCADQDLTPNQMSDLRDLARTCTSIVRWQAVSGKLQGAVDPDQEEMRMACWMIVHAISESWAQRDLTQDAERIFAKLQIEGHA